MLLYGCFYIVANGPLIRYMKVFKKFSLCAELNARASVDVSQWRGVNSFWPCSVNILEHSGCSSGSPGAPYLNNIILYIDIYII